jgi:uncharacterized membrane protein
MGNDDYDPKVEAWARRHRFKNGMRVLVVGAVVLVIGLVWMFRAIEARAEKESRPRHEYSDEIDKLDTDIDTRVTAGAVAAIGGVLVIGGIVMLARSGRRRQYGEDDDGSDDTLSRN